MTLQQRVGQVFMVGTPATAASSTLLNQISTYHVGNVILMGPSSVGTAGTAAVVRSLQRKTTDAATAGVDLFVATDQEGGRVQVLKGPGFATMPSALRQGGLSADALRADAAQWGAQLRAAGVTLNLAPVADTVPSAAFAPSNAPIGYYDREFGYDPATVGAHVAAFVAGMADSGVDTSIKHFPGLGRVTANTDTTSNVTDTVTVRGDPYLAAFADGVDAGTAFLMMSTAYYAKIDPNNPAAFSPTIIGGMVRGDLGFTGVVISDDIGAARQVAGWTAGQRAVKFIAAGGDMVLTVTPGVLPAMYQAVLQRAQTDSTFRARVDASVQRILSAKAARGLLGT